QMDAQIYPPPLSCRKRPTSHQHAGFVPPKAAAPRLYIVLDADSRAYGARKMRIIAGKLRGRRLHAVGSAPLRPTSDRLRETLFDIVGAARPLEGTVWLDLFAGTGAVGIEALSRGAA